MFFCLWRKNFHDIDSNDQTDKAREFRSKVYKMFLAGTNSTLEFADLGGQQAVADLLGIDRTSVSRYCKIESVSPVKATLNRKRRSDCLEESSPASIQTIQSFWVSNYGYVNNWSRLGHLRRITFVFFVCVCVCPVCQQQDKPSCEAPEDKT